MYYGKIIELLGEVGWPLSDMGSLVGDSSFRTPKVEVPISSAIALPLVSMMEEFQRASWALKSPVIMASPSGSRF